MSICASIVCIIDWRKKNKEWQMPKGMLKMNEKCSMAFVNRFESVITAIRPVMLLKYLHSFISYNLHNITYFTLYLANK